MDNSETQLTATTIWIAFGVITAAFIARGVKISEFRQAWIDGLRSDISEYISKSHEWIDLYIIINSEQDQKKKIKLKQKLDRLKYDSIHIHSRISLRFKPNDNNANTLLNKLLFLLDPSKLSSIDQYASWRNLCDDVVLDARVLLKEEWEATKNPLLKFNNDVQKCMKKRST